MTLHFPSSSFFEETGREVDQFGERLRDTIGDFACELWASYPAFFTQNKSIGSSFARGFMTSMCNSRVELPPTPSPPFQGGQCEGVRYIVTATASTSFNNEGRPARVQVHTTWGPIESVTVERPAPNTDPRIIAFVFRSHNADGTDRVVAFPIGGEGWSAELVEVDIVREDGLADTCGDPDVSYPGPQPTSPDLTRPFCVTLADGSEWCSTVTYNQIDVNNNFPIGFRIGGINAILDMSGLTIFSFGGSGNPDGNNSIPSPGGSGGGDGVGGGDLAPHPRQDYPTFPDLELPEPEEVEVDSIVCAEGVHEVIKTTLVVASGLGGWVGWVSLALNALLIELCEGSNEAVVGFPEYYSLLPGAGRAAIVFLWKEIDDGKWGSSTYSSTVHHPTESAIIDLEDLIPPSKMMGKYVASLKLLDGSSLRASGQNMGEATQNLNWLIQFVEPSKVPLEIIGLTVISHYPRLQEREVFVRAIEYYPDGAGAARTPETRRYIEADEY